MRVFIEPVDVWLFRDGRPFAGGEDHRAVSLFPPTPYTMQGAIRTKILFDRGVDLQDYARGAQCEEQKTRDVGREIGFPNSDYGKLRLFGPFVAKRNKNGEVVRYFPLPADVVKADDDYRVLSPLQRDDSPYTMNAMLNPLWLRTHQPITEAHGWLAEDELEKYLQGNQFSITKADDLFAREARLGIGIDNSTKRPQEGLLYQVEFMRLRQDVGLWLEVEGVTLPKDGLLQLGGEMKAARYEEVSNTPKLSPGGQVNGKFKLYFATPAYLSGGWQPRNGDWTPFFGKSVKLIAAAVPRAQMLGGAKVDVASQRGDFHKPMRPFVPAGSVYFFETDDEVTVPPTITDDGGQIGFGQVFIGGWDYV